MQQYFAGLQGLQDLYSGDGFKQLQEAMVAASNQGATATTTTRFSRLTRMRRPSIFKTRGLVISGCELKWQEPRSLSKCNQSKRRVTGSKGAPCAHTDQAPGSPGFWGLVISLHREWVTKGWVQDVVQRGRPQGRPLLL